MVSSLSGNYKGMCMVISSHFPNKTKSQDFRLRQRAYDLRCILTCHTWNLLQIFPTKNWSGKMNGCLWSTLLQSSAYHPNRVLAPCSVNFVILRERPCPSWRRWKRQRRKLKRTPFQVQGRRTGPTRKLQLSKPMISPVSLSQPFPWPIKLTKGITHTRCGFRVAPLSHKWSYVLKSSNVWLGFQGISVSLFLMEKSFHALRQSRCFASSRRTTSKSPSRARLSPAATRWVGASMVERLRHGMRHVAAPVCRLLNSSGIARKPWAANIYRSLMILFCGFGDTIAPMVNWGRPLYLS